MRSQFGKRISFSFLCLLCAFALHQLSTARAQPPPPLYSNDFEKCDEGDPPKDLVVLNGSFSIKSIDHNKVLELPGDPLDTFGALFGPETESNLCVQARIFATATGKRTPELGVGLGDSNGYRLWLMPATGQLQILKGDEVAASVSYPDWKSGSWTIFKLQARDTQGKAIVDGKAWPQGTPEPKDWMIHFADKEAPPKGRASVWGVPFSSTPIRFDDLLVMRASL